VDINTASETIRENIKMSAKQPNEGCSETSHHRTQANLQWLLEQSQTNGDNLNNVRGEAKQTFQEEDEKNER
jgi:hypothetical protein